jgi:hypothetical protein
MPWILGFFSPMSIDSEDQPEDLEGEGILPSEVAGGANANKEKINAGDLIWRTIGNCRLVLRAGGEIEIEATKICKRIMLPERNLINEICRNYEFRADGGTIDWVDHPEIAGKTIFKQVWRNDLKSTNIIEDTRGTVERGSDIIRRYEIKPGRNGPVGGGTIQVPEDSPYLCETYNTGKTELKISGLTFTTVVEADGDYTMGIGDYKYYCHIQPTGEMQLTINNNFNIQVLDTGETTLDIGISASHVDKQKPSGGTGKFHAQITPDGTTNININEKIDFKLNADGSGAFDFGPGKHTTNIASDGKTSMVVGSSKMTIEPSGKIEIDGSGNTITIKPSGEIEVKASTKINLKATQIIFNNQGSGIITANGTQNVVDFITGVPVIPSTTTFGDI